MVTFPIIRFGGIISLFYHVATLPIKVLYTLYLDRTNDCLYFGDEVEYTLVKFDSESNKVTVSLKAQHYLQVLENLDKEGKVRSENNFT